MKFRMLLLTFICLILTTSGYGYSRYFFVTAKNGIKLYEEPSFSSKQIIELPYNTPVELGGISEIIIDGKKIRWVEVIRNDKKGWVLFQDISSEYDSAPFLKQVTTIKKLFADAQTGNSHLNRNLKLNMKEKEIIGILGDRKKIISDEWGFIYVYGKLQIYFADSDHGIDPDTRISMFAFSVEEYSISLDHVKTVLGVPGKSFFDWSREVYQICYKAGDYAIALEYPLDDMKIKRCMIFVAPEDFFD